MSSTASIDRRRLAVAISGACAFANLYSTQPLLPRLGEEFGSSPARTSLTVTAGILSVALVAPIAGMLADGWGRKRVIVAAILALMIPTAAAGLAGSLDQLIFWRFVQGLCLPFIFTVTVAYVGEEWEPSEAAATTGLYIAGTIFGGFAGRVLAGAVTDLAGWRMVFPVMAVLDGLMALAVARWLPTETRFVRASADWRARLRGMAGHTRDPRLMAAFGVGFSTLFVLVATFTYVNFLLADPPYGLSSSALGAVFVVYLAGSAASPVAGRLVGRIGHRAVIALGVAIAVTGLSVTLAHPLWVIMIGLALTTTGVFIGQSVTTGFVATNATTARSAAVGLYFAAYYFGGSLGAVVPAVAWHHTGWPGVVAMVIAVELVIVTLAVIFWRPKPTG